MARIFEPTLENEEEWAKWLLERPECIREVAKRFDPSRLYRMKSTGQRVCIVCFEEKEEGPVTLKVLVSARFNCVVFERTVFGVEQEDLEECDLPSEDEVVGAIFTEEQDIEAYIARLKSK